MVSSTTVVSLFKHVKRELTLIILSGAPSQPFIESPQYLRSNGSVKLSWLANLTEGVDHNYTIIIHNVTSITPVLIVNETVVVLYYLFEQCGDFDVQVRTVNKAGESKFSNTVKLFLPLLPLIQPVSNSLMYTAWKSASTVMVKIKFEVSFLIAS